MNISFIFLFVCVVVSFALPEHGELNEQDEKRLEDVINHEAAVVDVKLIDSHNGNLDERFIVYTTDDAKVNNKIEKIHHPRRRNRNRSHHYSTTLIAAPPETTTINHYYNYYHYDYISDPINDNLQFTEVVDDGSF